KAWQQVLQVADVGLELLCPTVEDLAHAYWHRIHQVRAAGLDVVMDLLSLALDDLYKPQQRWKQLLVQRQRGAHVKGGRDDVVAALAAVDMIVGIDRLAQQTAGQRG